MQSVEFKSKLNFFENLCQTNKPKQKDIGSRTPKRYSNKVRKPAFANVDIFKEIKSLEKELVEIEKDDAYMFTDLDDFIKQMEKPSNTQNVVQLCGHCNMIFDSNHAYESHVNACDSYFNNYKISCPICSDTFSTESYLGEHFINAHNDYNIFCKLDERSGSGFPGFDLLRRINMIKKVNKIVEDDCTVCKIGYGEENKRPIRLLCCKKLICRDCLFNYLSITDTVICPYCLRDHTRYDSEYIVVIEEINQTDPKKWLPWWINHVELFNQSVS